MFRRTTCRMAIFPRAVGHPEVAFPTSQPYHTLQKSEDVTAAILEKSGPFGGVVGGVSFLVGLGLFFLTYGHNIAVPVIDAYASLNSAEEEEDDDDGPIEICLDLDEAREESNQAHGVRVLEKYPTSSLSA